MMEQILKRCSKCGEEKTLSEFYKDKYQLDGFTIITSKGTSLTASDLRLNKKVDLASHGNSVSREAAFNSLGAYFNELKQTGILEQ